MVTFTSSEYKLLVELSEGYSNSAIARRLSYTKGSVDAMTTRLYDKLDIPVSSDIIRRIVAINIFKGEYSGNLSIT